MISTLSLKLQIFQHTVQHDMQMLADAKVNLAIKLLKSIGQLAHSFPMLFPPSRYYSSEPMNLLLRKGNFQSHETLPTTAHYVVVHTSDQTVPSMGNTLDC